MPLTAPRRFAAALLLLSAAVPALAQIRQRPSDHGSIVIVVGQEPTTPIPTLLGAKANNDVSDLLFLRLARPGRSLVTTEEKTFEPQLARSWTRRDSLTLSFELDPKARWHDGVPVTARDVLFSFARMRDSTVDPQRALLLRYLAGVTAEGERRVVFRFRRAYPEQFYDATWHVQLLPAHLVDTIPPERFAASAFVRAPVGNGPYRWVRREPGQKLELAGDPAFFLGAPKVDRVIFLLVRDPEAALNLLLDGSADAYEAVPPTSGPARLAANPELRLFTVPSFSVVYLLFNERAYGERGRPHPILADAAVRRALVMGIDRNPLIRSAYGAYGLPAMAPVPAAHWTYRIAPKGPGYDPAAARALLQRQGWSDHDGDGVLDKNGMPLALRLNFPTTSAPRAAMAPQLQEQLRRIGVRLELVRLDGPVWIQRRQRGEFDLDFSAATMDPAPSGVVQSWTCRGRGGSNLGQYCDPAVDSALDRAISSARGGEREWRAAYAALQNDAPALFLASPQTAFALHRRFRAVNLRPESLYSDLWRWSVDPGRRLPRDR
ncbi:MAG TPA: peptide ABC transporter substrate-binding protein [Gemmatimonadales bacterium]|nr:peptide ABC transporter substrate-binding protein [Gemmatimonadales bacterium]